jgi:hypothetical protein
MSYLLLAKKEQGNTKKSKPLQLFSCFLGSVTIEKRRKNPFLSIFVKLNFLFRRSNAFFKGLKRKVRTKLLNLFSRR